MNFLLTPRSFQQFLGKVKAQANHDPKKDQYQIINASFNLKNPLDRLVMEPGINFDPARAVANFFTLIEGVDWHGVAPELFPPDLYLGVNHELLPEVVQKLDAENNVILSLSDPRSLLGDFHRRCLMFQLVVSENSALDIVASFSSIDLIKELPEDIFVTTMLQEFIARHLGVQPGQTYLNTGLATMQKVEVDALLRRSETSRWPFVMGPMPFIQWDDLEEWHTVLLEILESPVLFLSSVHKPVFNSPEIHTYLKTLTSVMVVGKTLFSNPDICLLAYDEIKSASFKRLIRPFMIAAGITDTRRRLHAS